MIGLLWLVSAALLSACSDEPKPTTTSDPPFTIHEGTNGSEVIDALTDDEVSCLRAYLDADAMDNLASVPVVGNSTWDAVAAGGCLEVGKGAYLSFAIAAARGGGLSDGSWSCLNEVYTKSDAIRVESDSMPSGPSFSTAGTGLGVLVVGTRMLLCLSVEKVISLHGLSGSYVSAASAEELSEELSNMRCLFERVEVEEYYIFVFDVLFQSTQGEDYTPDLLETWGTMAAASEACGGLDDLVQPLPSLSDG